MTHWRPLGWNKYSKGPDESGMTQVIYHAKSFNTNTLPGVNIYEGFLHAKDGRIMAASGPVLAGFEAAKAWTDRKAKEIKAQL